MHAAALALEVGGVGGSRSVREGVTMTWRTEEMAGSTLASSGHQRPVHDDHVVAGVLGDVPELSRDPAGG